MKKSLKTKVLNAAKDPIASFCATRLVELSSAELEQVYRYVTSRRSGGSRP